MIYDNTTSFLIMIVIAMLGVGLLNDGNGRLMFWAIAGIAAIPAAIRLIRNWLADRAEPQE